MRRMRKKGGKSTEGKSSRFLTGSSQNSSPSLEERVRILEKRVEALEDGLAMDIFPERTQKKPGPHPKLFEEDLLVCRDGLVDCLEMHWPDLRPNLLSASGKEEITAALMPFAGPQTSRGLLVQRLIDHAGALLSFLKSDRFHRKPPKRTVIDALNRPLDDERRMKAAARLPTRQIA